MGCDYHLWAIDPAAEVLHCGSQKRHTIGRTRALPEFIHEDQRGCGCMIQGLSAEFLVSQSCMMFLSRKHHALYQISEERTLCLYASRNQR